MKKAVLGLLGFCFIFSAGILISGCTEETKNTYNNIINNNNTAPEEALFGEWVAISSKIVFKPGINYIERAYEYEGYAGSVLSEKGYFIADGKTISFKRTHWYSGGTLQELVTPLYYSIDYRFTNNGQTLESGGITFNKVS